MNKQISKMDKQSRFELCRKNLREYSDAYWGVMFEIWTDQLWENEYDSFEEFRRAEVEYSERWVRKRLAAEGTKRLLDRNKVPVAQLKTAHFEAVSAVDDPKEQAEIVKEVLEECKEEEREPTTKDFKKAVKERMPEPEANGKAHEPEPDGWPEAEADPSIIKDDIDRDVPQKLREKHALKPAIITCGNKLNAIIREVEELGDKPGGEFIQTVHIKQLLKEAKGLIQDAAYYTECPDCKGKKCSRCEGGAGFIPKRMKNMLSDAEKGLLGI